LAPKGCSGCVFLPRHKFAFQYSQQGYFIYETIDCEGLYQFPDKKTFFEQLKKQIQYDLAIIQPLRTKDPEIKIKIIPME